MDDFQKKKSFYKKPAFVILVLALIFAIAGASFYFFNRAKKSPYKFIQVKRGQVLQEVSVTGRVKPAESVNLAFEKSGKAQTISVKVGDKVSVGQNLVTLNNSDLAAQVAQAQASLQREQANLDQLAAGSRSEDLQIAQTTVANAQKSLADAKANLVNVQNKATVDLANLYSQVRDILNDAYLGADDALNKQTDGLFVNANSTNPQLSFYTSSQLATDAPQKRQAAITSLKQLNTILDSLPADQTGLDTALLNSEKELTSILNFMNVMGDALTNSTGLVTATLTSYKYNINLGRSNLTDALTAVATEKQEILTQKATNQTNINTAQTSVNSAQNTLSSAQDNLILKQAGSTIDQIAAQAAQVKYAQANLQSARASLDKTILLAPIDGVVTQQNTAIGEIIAANTTIVSINSSAQFEMETNIPEADIAKIKIGDRASVTLDTYGNSVIFDATVTSIDPAETLIDNVATYKTKLQFTQKDDRVKSGMTANIDVLTAKRENVLYVPIRSVTGKNGEFSVMLGSLTNTQVKTQKITVGLKGSDGNYEVIGGLKEGDQIVSFTQSQ